MLNNSMPYDPETGMPYVPTSEGIEMGGTINASGGEVIISGYDVNVTDSGSIYTGVTFRDPQKAWTADDYRKNIINMKGVENATTALEMGEGVVLSSAASLTANGLIESWGSVELSAGTELNMGGTVKSAGRTVTLQSKDGDLHMSGSIESNGGDVTLKTEDNLYVEGTSEKKASITSGGGDIKVLVESKDADLQAKPGEIPPDGMISIKDAYIDSSSKEKDSGDIKISATRHVMGVSRIDIDGAEITAAGKNGHNAGDVSILATAQTQLYAWDIGDGSYAIINMGSKETSGKKNTITGDNVTVAAVASTTGQVGSSDGTGDDNDTMDPELAEKLADSDSDILNLLKDYGGNLRAVISATDITAKSEVNMYDTDLNAVGGQKPGGNGHGNLSVTSHAESRIAPITIGAVGYGVNVGISDLSSKINTDRSNLYADKDVKMEATGENTVDMMFIELGLADKAVRSTVNFSWAELSSDVGVSVGKRTNITSGGDVDIRAESIRTLKSSVSNGSDANVIGAAVSVAIGKTDANAMVEGNIYAGGDVRVTASNRVAETEGGVPVADTSKAASMSGDSYLKPVVNAAKDGGGWLWGKIKEGGSSLINKIKTLAGKELSPDADQAAKDNDAGSDKQVWNKFGLNAATALLFSDNEANASVTGTVRAAVKDNVTGLYKADAAKGVKSLTVAADTLSRSTVRSITYQQELTNKDGSPASRKDTAVAMSVNYAQQENKANAWVGGDIKVSGDLEVDATNEMPWKTPWHSDNWVEILKELGLGSIDTTGNVSDLFDTWSQAAGDGESTSASASIGVVEYENEANAYIAEGAKIEVGGNLNVNALNDAVTVNISGALKNPLTKTPLGILVGDSDFKSYIQSPLGGNTENSIGGSALSVHQDNTARAYIADGAVVIVGKDVDIQAENSSKNVTFTAAGGASSSTAVQGTVAVNRIDNVTEAYIGSGASVTSNTGDVNVEAEDSSSIINVAGAIGISGDTSIGATIGYNHVDRVTSAYNKGHITAKNGNVSITADNTGLLVTASAAGSVTHDVEKPEGTESNTAGSTGLTEIAGSLLNTGVARASAVEALQNGANVAGLVNDLGASNAGKELSEKTDAVNKGFALSANVGVNRVLDTVNAYVSGGSVTAGSLGVSSNNDSHIITATGALAMNLGASGGTSIAGTFMYNSISAENNAYVDGAELTLTGSTKKDEDGKESKESLTVKAENNEEITNIAASGSGTTKGTAVAGQIGVNWIQDNTRAYVTNSVVKADEKTDISAENHAKLISGIGSVSVSAGGQGTAVGASVGVNLIQNETKAYMDASSYKGTEESDRGGEIAISANDKSDITSIVVGGGAADGFAGAFSANASVIITDTEARVNTDRGIYSKALAVAARNGATTTLGTGTAAVGNNAAGMAIGVNVSNNTVKAGIQGDSQKKNSIDADTISVDAVNAFNESASADTDLDKEGTAKNVAVGAAAGVSKFGGSGSVTMNFITQTTDASIGKGLYTSAGDISVNAVSSAKLFGLAGGVGASSGAGIGAGIDTQVYDGHTYASIEDGAKISKAGDVTIKAESTEEMTSVGFAGGVGGSFAGAGAAGMHILSSDTKAYIGNKDDKTVKAEEKTEIQNAGNVTVNAFDTTTLSTTSAGGAIGGTAAGGLSAAVEVVSKNVAAYVGNHASIGASGLAVNAENYGKSNNNAVGLAGGGTAGLAGSASETIVDYDTKAYVGDSADVTISGANNNGVTIDADSDFIQIADAGAAGVGGTAGVGIANATVKFNADTSAYIGKGAVIAGGKKVAVSADHLTEITYATVAGAASGTVAVNGAVGVNYLTTNTLAYAADDARISADGTEENEGISISAADTTNLEGGTGGAAVGGAVGGGAAVTVNHIEKNTKAYVGKGAALNSQGDISIDATNKENIFNRTLQGSGGASAGLAGAVTVTDINAITMAYTDTGVTVNQGESYQNTGGDISVNALHEIERLDSTVTGAAGSGGASVGAAVDVATIKTQTNAYIGDGNRITTNGALTVTAEDNMHNIVSRPVSAAIGAVGLAGSFSIYGFSSTIDTSELGGNDGSGDTTFDAWINEKMKEANQSVEDAMGAYDNAAAGKIGDYLNDLDFDSAPSTKGEAGTLAKIGQDSVIQAGSVKVDAKDHIGMDTQMGNLGGGIAGAGASVSIINSNTQVKALIDRSVRIHAAGALTVNAAADHAMKSTIVGAAVGGVAVQGTVQTWNDMTDVYAEIADTEKNIEAGSVEVSADNDHTLDATITGASAALTGALNGSVITANVGGVSHAAVGKANVKAKDGDLTVKSSADTDLNVEATGAAAGYFLGGSGTGATLASDVDTKTSVASGAALSGKNISITSVNTPKLSALATSAGVGLAGVGATVAKVESKDDAGVEIGDNVYLTAGDAITITAETAKPKEGYNAYAHAIAGAGGVVSGAVSTTDIIMDNDTTVVIGKHNQITGGSLDITAKHEDLANLENESIAAGGVSGTGAETNFTIDSAVNVSIGDDTVIQTKEETAIRAENITNKGWISEDDSRSNVYSGGASLANGNGIVNVTTITHNTKTDIGKVQISASASPLTEKEKENGVVIGDKNAITIDAHSSITAKDDLRIATGALVGAAHIKNTASATATTTTAVADGAVLRSGDTEAANGTNDHTMSEDDNKNGYTFQKDVGGGTIAVGSRNDAKLSGVTMVDVWGAAGYAGSENNVTYTGHANTTFGGDAETAKGDIRIAAGRDSSGSVGMQDVYAKSDILNATAIPISIKKDPVATWNSDAKMTLTTAGDLRSDRDIYLQSTAGKGSAKGTGEVKDWVNAVGDAFGSDGSKIGKSEITTSADTELNGSAQTGIHRHINVTISGQDNKGTWVTTVTQTGDVSYTFSPEVGVGESLSERLQELKNLKSEYSTDAAAVAAYEAEIAFIEAKMVEQGLGYYEDGDTSKFVQLDLGTTTELDSSRNILQQMVDSKDKALASLKEAETELQGQKESMEAIGTMWNTWNEAKKELSTAETAKNQAQVTFDTAKSNAETAAANANMTLDEYLTSSGADQNIVQTYSQSKQNLENASAAYEGQAGKVNADWVSYENQVKQHNTAYQTEYKADALDSAGMKKDYDALSDGISKVQEYQQNVETDVVTQQGQVSATDLFITAGGKDIDGKFYLNGQAVTQYTAKDGKTYNLLHFSDYGQKTHNVEIGNITAQLGDINLEGDNVYGTGSLAASGDASVHIKNETPNNLIVGDIKVINTEQKSTLTGKDGSAINVGGQIYFNNEVVTGKEGIQSKNKDKDKNVGFSKVEDRNNTKAPTILIENTFNPKDHVYADGDFKGTPYYAAPELHLNGNIYNTRGEVTVTSRAGDVYNEGSIQAGTVSLTATSGDFVQSYGGKTLDKQIANIGGVPNKDGTVSKDSGILANGNIFISARYVNVNSKIQSGVADYSVTIPDNVTVSYTDGNGNVQTKTLAEVNALPNEEKSKWTFTVNGAEGNAKDNLRYDAVNERFVLDGIEVKGGKVQIVGTIMNTSKDGAAVGRIEALDGYGGINVTNNSNVPIELKTLNTGSGVHGVIEITDLDLGTGEIARKTTYTRDENGQIRMDVETYSGGKVTGNSGETFAKGEDGVYKPAEGLYYQWQEGRKNVNTVEYNLTTTELDWWGIENERPTKQDILKEGGKIVDVQEGKWESLSDGTLITKADGKDWINKNEYYSEHKGEATPTGEEKEVYYDSTSKRLWYTLGLAKKYDITIKMEEGSKEINSYAVNASHDIGIRFNGNQSGGTINVTGNNADVIIGGSVSNVGGKTEISTNKNIVQGANGYVNTGSLVMNAGGNAGTQGGAIQTSANAVSGTTGGNFYVSVENHGVNLGNITAGKTASIAAVSGITQNAGAVLKANRVELDAGSGAITGGYTDADNGLTNAVHIETGKPGEGDDSRGYGLKASAYGDIAIYNGSDDLYLDSVTSESGNVSLVTKGSFIDNNFTDTEDESAKEKLDAWASAAVLENSEATIDKQKEMLIDKVESKYNRYQLLKANVKDGKYVLSDADKNALQQAGVMDIDGYIAERQAEYDNLKNAGVGSWTKESVETYTTAIRNSADTTKFGNASLTKSDLVSDAFLTADEKAEVLVGSAKSAQDLLVTFTEGGIKDGITDTNTSYKGTPHVSGKDVMLKALGTNGEEHSGNIGQKVEGMEIDLSDPWNLTREQLLALSTAERGDFKIDGNRVTVSSVQAISADASGTVKAYAEKGAIYLVSESAFNAGSELFADDEVRLKVSDDLEGITVGSNDQIILESGEGAIKDVTVTGEGVLTARAQDGVDITKGDESDLIINTVYASEGDVNLTVQSGGHILADSKTNTTGLHVQGQNVTFNNAGNIGATDAALGVKVTGTETASGKVDAQVSGDVHMIINGTIEKDSGTVVSGANVDIINHGNIHDGQFTGTKDFTLTNGGSKTEVLIDGGTFFTEGTMTVINRENGTFAKTDEETEASVTGNTVYIQNEGTISGGIFHATGERGDDGKGNVTYNAENGSITAGGTLISEKADVVVNGGGTDIKLDKIEAVNGKADISNVGDVSVADVHVGGAYQVESAGSVVFDTIDAGRANITAGGNVSGEKLTTAEDSKVKAENDVTITESYIGGTYNVTAGGNVSLADAAAEGGMTVTAGGNVENTNLTAGGDVAVEAGGSIVSETLAADGQNVTITSGGKTEVGHLTAGSASLTTENEEGDVELGEAAVEDMLSVDAKGNTVFDTIDAGSTDITAGGSVSGNSLTTVVNEDIEGADGHAYVEAETGSVTITESDIGGTYTVTAKEDAELGTAKADGNTEVTAGGSITNTSMESGGSLTMNAEGGTLISDAIKANGNTTLNSAGDMEISNLDTESDAALTSKGEDIHVNFSDIEGTLSMNAGKDITVTQSESVELDMNAGGSIKTEGKDASITSGDISMSAGQDIHLSTQETVEKLEGVTGDTAGAVSGSGSAGSIVTGTGDGHAFDVSQKGDAVIESTTGKMDLSAGSNVSADTVILGKGDNDEAQLTVNANNVGIDDLQSGAGRTEVTVNGPLDNGDYAHYAGIHTTSDGETIIKDSHVEHLDFTGTDNLGLENTNLSGDSQMATEHVTVTLDKNTGTSSAEHIGTLVIRGDNIDGDTFFGDIHDGETLNWHTHPLTGMSVMNRALYGTDTAGKEEEEDLEEAMIDNTVEILFAEVLGHENYRVVSM